MKFEFNPKLDINPWNLQTYYKFVKDLIEINVTAVMNFISTIKSEIIRKAVLNYVSNYKANATQGGEN